MRVNQSACLLLLLVTSGCAAWKEQVAPQPTVADNHLDRQAAIRSFEQHRDQMQLQAAIDRFDQGDFAGCESRLQTLVERRPDFAEARLRLAEITWARGNTDAAEGHYLAVLAAHPNSAEAHHGLGMLLEANGRFDEAQPHLRSAAELDPQNEAYRLADSDATSTHWQ